VVGSEEPRQPGGAGPQQSSRTRASRPLFPKPPERPTRGRKVPTSSGAGWSRRQVLWRPGPPVGAENGRRVGRFAWRR
jgi:hypothetical protein